MSVNVEIRTVPRGDDDCVEEVWTLKERISAAEDVLKQRRAFFTRAYRRTRVHLLCADDEIVGFAAARSDGYILFLAVAPDHRGEGFGRRLVTSVAEECDSVTCHARATNEDALAFYDHLGFDRVRRIDGYYEDGGDAFFLRLGEESGIRERLSDLLGR